MAVASTSCGGVGHVVGGGKGDGGVTALARCCLPVSLLPALTFLFLVISTWKGWICLVVRSHATASASRMQERTPGFSTWGKGNGGEGGLVLSIK